MTQPTDIDPMMRKAQVRIMAGLAMVLVGAMFGGVLAMVLYMIGRRDIAMWVIDGAGAIGLAGIVLQVLGYLDFRKAKRKGGA